MTGETSMASSDPDGTEPANSPEPSSQSWESTHCSPVYPGAFLPDASDPPDSERAVLTTQAEVLTELDLPPLQAFAVGPGVTDPDAERAVRFQPHSDPPSCPATFCTRIDGGAVWTPGFIAFAPPGHYLADSVRTPRLMTDLGLPLEDSGTIGPLPSAVYTPETAILIGNLQAQNYFHWLFESVARLGVLALADLGVELSDAKYVVPELTAAQAESLLRAGIRDDQLLSLTDRFVQFSRLYVPSRGLERIYRFSRAGVAYLRSLGPESKPKRRLYLTRKNSGRRRIENESEVVEMLSSHGFAAVAAETLSFDQQVELFSQARAIVAPHGAGLANIAFMPPGGAVLEVQPEGLDYAGSAMYRSLAAVAEQRYGALVGRGAARGSIEVDLGLLESLVRELS